MILPFSAVLWAGHAMFRARGYSVRTLPVEGGRRVVVYEKAGFGTGPRALLVHGLGGNAMSWLRLAPQLLRACRSVAIVELPGHGRLALAEGEAPAGPAELALALAAALLDLSSPAQPVVLIGNSLGGALSINAAAAFPDRVAAVVGLSPAGAPIAGEERAGLLRAFGSGVAGVPEMARRLYHRPPPGLWLFTRSLARLWGSPAVQHVLAQMPAPTEAGLPSALLEALQQPALVLWGDSDRLLPPSSVDYFRRHLRSGTVELIERCGHVPQMERPEVVGPRIVRFLAALPASQRAREPARAGA